MKPSNDRRMRICFGSAFHDARDILPLGVGVHRTRGPIRAGPHHNCSRVDGGTCALVQARLGMDAVRVLFDDMLRIVTVVMLNGTLHTNALAALLGANRRNLSLVDSTIFAAMRHRGTVTVFAFDRRFAEQGFQPVS